MPLIPPVFIELHPRVPKLGDIATEYMIRRKKYTLVKTMGKSIIQTARSDCDKVFFEQLKEGHALKKYARVHYIPVEETLEKDCAMPHALANDPEFRKYIGILEFYKGSFKKSLVLPTKDMDFPINEMIETPTGEFVKVQ